MDMKILTAVTAGALLLGVSQAAAASLTIDSFITDQAVSDKPTTVPDQPTNSEVAADEALGDHRDLYVITGGTFFGDSTLQAGITDGVLRFSNAAGVSGSAFVTYDGDDDDATTVDEMGLGGVNFLIGNQSLVTTGFQFTVISLDITGGLTAGITVWDMDGDTATFEGPVSEGGDTFVPFALFGNPLIDWDDIGAVQFFASAIDDVDARIGPITISAVPVPAAGFLLLGGLGALAAVRRKQKKA